MSDENDSDEVNAENAAPQQDNAELTAQELDNISAGLLPAVRLQPSPIPIPYPNVIDAAKKLNKPS